MHFHRNLLVSKCNMHLLRDCLLLGKKEICALKMPNLKISSHKVMFKEICNALTSIKEIFPMHILNLHTIKKMRNLLLCSYWEGPCTEIKVIIFRPWLFSNKAKVNQICFK